MRNHLFIARKSLALVAKPVVLILVLLQISWAAHPARSSEAASLPVVKASGAQKAMVSKADPWTEADLIRPEALARILAARDSHKPTLVYVGFPLLFKAGRIPGAMYFGPGRSAEGLAGLKKWARGLRQDQPVVMYCGCCPWGECPNIRPAFKVLREAGLRDLKLLYLPTGLVRDWVEKDYPFQRGS